MPLSSKTLTPEIQRGINFSDPRAWKTLEVIMIHDNLDKFKVKKSNVITI